MSNQIQWFAIITFTRFFNYFIIAAMSRYNKVDDILIVYFLLPKEIKIYQ